MSSRIIIILRLRYVHNVCACVRLLVLQIACLFACNFDLACLVVRFCNIFALISWDDSTKSQHLTQHWFGRTMQSLSLSLIAHRDHPSSSLSKSVRTPSKADAKFSPIYSQQGHHSSRFKGTGSDVGRSCLLQRVHLFSVSHLTCSCDIALSLFDDDVCCTAFTVGELLIQWRGCW